MKIFKLFKSIPFLLISLILIILNLNNQNENTKLKLLIWNTPSLTLGTYISLSTGSGYLLSYIFTTSLSKSFKFKSHQTINDNSLNEYPDTNFYQQTFNGDNYDNTLIERDIKDPSPTIKASFRVIGKTNRKIDISDNEVINKYNSFNNSNEVKSNYNTTDTNNEFKPTLNDWEEDDFTNW